MKWLPLQQLGLRKINSSHEWIFHDLRARKNFYCVIIILNSFFFAFQNLHVPCVHLKCQFLFFINRNNLEWLGRATNWAKFTATASLGVIHKVCVTYVGYVCKQKKTKIKKGLSYGAKNWLSGHCNFIADWLVQWAISKFQKLSLSKTG